MLAARWARAVLTPDPHAVAVCEAVAVQRGTTIHALVAATKKSPEEEQRRRDKAEYAKNRFKTTTEQSQKNIREGKSYNTGQKKSGYNPYRKGKGPGGGQFASEGEGGGGGGGKSKSEREAEKAKKEAERVREQMWRLGEEERAAKQKAAEEGNYGPLLRFAEKMEAARRKQRDLAETDEERDAAEQAVTDAGAYLDDVKAKAAKAKADKESAAETKKATEKTARETEAEKKRVERKTASETETARKKLERETATEAERKAEYAAIAKNYPVWEGEIRKQYEGRDLSEAELAELVLRDRARRVRALPRARRSLTSAGFDPNLHPRGRDGKFITVFGLVDLHGLAGFQHGQRGHQQVQGQVVEIVADSNKPGDPIIRVKMTDPRWDASKFGPTVDVRRNQVSERVKPKGTLKPDGNSPSPIPTVTAETVKPQIVDDGAPPPRAATPGMTPHPDGPNFKPIPVPDNWATMHPQERAAFLKKTMEDDFTQWRGEPVGFDFDKMDSGIALNLANTYRELANWDPDTARRVDHGVFTDLSDAHVGNVGSGAIAVAHPGTAHPGGIGPKVKPSQIVFGSKYLSGMAFWHKQKAISDQSKVPHSTSSMTGDPSITLVHEFGHQRQFRYLDIAMRDVGQAWSDTVREDGFGLIPDSSNWPETQALRYQIPKLTQTQYGHSKSSEGFAEGIAERALGISSPELNATFDQWDELMAVSLSLPEERHATTRTFDELTDSEKDQFWQTNGPFLDLPGMRDHYPESASEYDAWRTGKPVQPSEPVVVNAADGSPISVGQTVDLAGDTYTVTATKMSPKAYSGGHFDSPEGAGPIPQQGMVKLQSAQGSDMGWFLADAVTPQEVDWDEGAAELLKPPPDALSFMRSAAKYYVGGRNRNEEPPGPIPWTVTVYDPVTGKLVQRETGEEVDWDEGAAAMMELSRDDLATQIVDLRRQARDLVNKTPGGHLSPDAQAEHDRLRAEANQLQAQFDALPPLVPYVGPDGVAVWPTTNARSQFAVRRSDEVAKMGARTEAFFELTGPDGKTRKLLARQLWSRLNSDGHDADAAMKALRRGAPIVFQSKAGAPTQSGWDEGAAEMVPVPTSVTGPGGEIPLTTLSDDTGRFEPGGWADPATITSVQEGLTRVANSYPNAPPLRTIGIRPEQTALGNKSIDTITVGSMFHDPEFWVQRRNELWAFAGNGTPAATIFHEYGHILDGALTQEQRKPLDAIVREPITYNVNGQPVTAPRWQVGSPVNYPNPSVYASESPYEFVAEALTDVEFNGDAAAPISQEIAAIFAEVFA